MRAWTATTTVEAPPDAVLGVLTDPGACARRAPADVDVEVLEAEATSALLSAGALNQTRSRIGRERAAIT